MAYSNTHFLECLYSVVRNISSSAKTFTFLPPHGKTLAAQEEYSMWGDIQEAIKTDYVGQGNYRKIQGFLNALDTGVLQLVRNPYPILENAAGNPQMVFLRNGTTLAIDDPCWSSLDGSNVEKPLFG